MLASIGLLGLLAVALVDLLLLGRGRLSAFLADIGHGAMSIRRAGDQEGALKRLPALQLIGRHGLSLPPVGEAAR